MVFITSGTIQGKQLDEKEKEFREKILSNPIASEAALFELHDFFKSTGPMTDWENRASYFRWYTELIWRRLNSQSRETFMDIAIARQIPLAMLLDIDVWRELMWYLATWVAEDKKDLEEYYEKIKKSFLGSRAIVGYWQGKEVTVEQLVKELNTINVRGSNSLQVAEYNSRLKEIMSAKNDPELSKYVMIDPNEAVIRFVDLVNFFIGITADTIWYVVDAFAHPEEIEPAVLGEEKKSINIATVVAAGKAAAKVTLSPSPNPTPMLQSTQTPTPTEEIITPPVAFQKPPRVKKASEAKEENVEKLSFTELKARIDNQFKKDAKGQFVNISDVLRELERLAAKYRDDRIRDLYIFNEGAGRFEWNDKLIGEQKN